MGYKLIIQILLILAIISTICISIIKPKMHEPVMVYNSQFTVSQDENVKIDEQEIPVLVQSTDISGGENNVVIENQGGINFVEPTTTDITPVNIGNNVDNTKISQSKIPSNSNIGFKNSNSGFKSTPVKSTNNIAVTKTQVSNQNNTTSQAPKIDLNKIINNNQKLVNTPTQSSSVPTASTPVKTVQPSATQKPQTKTQNPQTPAQTQPQIRLNTQTTQEPLKTAANTTSEPVKLTAAQEEIAWNKWRSNLNNQIMKDSKLPTMPNGIVFKYKFTVDKYGKVSNVQTSSTTPGYTPYAIQFIAPVIRSYQGRSILNFPAGSNRVTTEVSGAWKISSNSKLSTPDDYNDIEKIKR